MSTDRDLDRDVELAVGAHRRLLADLDVLVAGGNLDVESPSRLPDWTCGHVLAHIRQSGDGFTRMIEAAARGEVGAQYPGGVAGRAADIEKESILPAREQVDMLRSSIARIETAFAGSNWEGEGEGVLGVVKIAELPFMRMREVSIHHVDLGFGYGFEDLPAEYIRLELRRMEMLWKARQPMGMTPLPDSALAAPPEIRLAWLVGRTGIEGLEPAAIF